MLHVSEPVKCEDLEIFLNPFSIFILYSSLTKSNVKLKYRKKAIKEGRRVKKKTLYLVRMIV